MPQDYGKKTEVLPKVNPVLPENILFGQSTAMKEIRHAAGKISQTSLPVLLSGEGGTGKEAVARWLHANSTYKSGEFIKVNCAAIPGALLESELFGYERGAFTGANAAKPGRVESANGGTLFLDEIADLDLQLQSKLLHFLQDGTFSRIGDTSERRVDTRVICASNKDLRVEIEAGRFRQDLYYRIQVFRLELPPLRDRREDIPNLAEYFRAQFAWFGCALLAFLLVVNELVFRANRTSPRQLSDTAFAAALVIFLAFSGVWTIRMILHFSRKPAG